MSSLFEIQCSTGVYGVYLAPQDSNMRKSSPNTRVCLVDSNVLPYVPEGEYEIVIPIDATEDNKSLDAVGRVIIELKSNSVTREDIVDVIGGGILQDIGTLSTSIYMRGIKWNYFPTTLLGMVDSCIGGKSSINHGGYKNIIGNFHTPGSIFIHPSFCKTLDEQKILEGLFEAIKICLAFGEPSLNAIYDLIEAGAEPSSIDFTNLITTSLDAKKYFIEIDEFDQGPRLQLNFGHTFGHAIEAATNYRVPHGIAVGIGMLLAYDVAPEFGVSCHQAQERFTLCVKRLLNTWPNKDNVGSWLDPQVALEAFENDKKHRRNDYNLILPNATGNLEKVAITKNEKSQSIILKSFENIGTII